ncbi:hypothetical protein V8F06_013962 [Rhypophila decipiens]
MSLRQNLVAPFVVEPREAHTHTVVFLHRLPETTKDADLPAKDLAKLKPPDPDGAVPNCSCGHRPYNNLTAEDKAAVELAGSSPYITQILLREAKLLREAGVANGLERVILGGQGETAEAGHDAMASFPEVRTSILRMPEQVAAFMRETLHCSEWSDPSTDPRLAGYVGMHAEDAVVTRDLTAYRAAKMKIASSSSSSPASPNDGGVNSSIIANTPHRFIHGGYKVTTPKWDGRRYDEFASFLADDLGVYRVPFAAPPKTDEQLRKERKAAAEEQARKHQLTTREKSLEELAADKAEEKERLDKVRRSIEADNRERRERAARRELVKRVSPNPEGRKEDAPKAARVPGAEYVEENPGGQIRPYAFSRRLGTVEESSTEIPFQTAEEKNQQAKEERKMAKMLAKKQADEREERYAARMKGEVKNEEEVESTGDDDTDSTEDEPKRPGNGADDVRV